MGSQSLQSIIIVLNSLFSIKEFDENIHGKFELEEGYLLAKIDCGNMVTHTRPRNVKKIGVRFSIFEYELELLEMIDMFRCYGQLHCMDQNVSSSERLSLKILQFTIKMMVA